ncbi:hypothetical protein K2173_004237 [Erythroxylum novogranatense]|uniref:Uncharacterized protein n=1 Tax=Erythroxylum novogranatense TaxID=1862640 RepID=A0AAV8U826_9ROSI|nr:hypothetical protein K2173_004237 [Erythroxylum novogranatense]
MGMVSLLTASSLAPLLCTLFLTLTSATFSDDTPTAYEVLQDYDFPVGIIPKGVTGYKLNKETGEFSAYLSQTCKFPIESYELEYKSTIRGVISKDKITNLQGVQVKVLFFWLNIVEVVRDGDELQFSVGLLSANFPIDNFFECPQCGCGLNCDKLRSSLVSYS